MIAPTIHPNGTPAARLLSQYANARFALSKALAMIREIELNERDYYPQGDAAWRRAREGMRQVVDGVEEFRHRLEDVEKGIREQVEEK